jgi:competence protein ComEA
MEDEEKKKKIQEKIGVVLFAGILLMIGLILTKTDTVDSNFVSNDANNIKTSNQIVTATTLKENDVKTGKVSINKASIEDLDTLPGIGEVIAGRIIDYRTKNGDFKSLEGLKEVSGIGEVKYANVKDLISL